MLFQNPPYMAPRQPLIPQITALGTSFIPLPCHAWHGYGVTGTHRVEVEVGADRPASAPSSGAAAASPPAGAVHSHLDTELTRATPPELSIPPWEHPANPDRFVIESRGDSTLTLTDMITRETFNKTIHSQGPHPRRYPQRDHKIPTPSDPLRPFLPPFPPRPQGLYSP
jgi:hypothetical protein